MSADRTSETLYLIDAYSLIFQVFHALPEMPSPSGLPVNAVFGFAKDMLFLRNQKQPTYLVVCFDGSSKTFRDDMYAEYKAHRSPIPDDLLLQIPLIKEMLEGMRIPLLVKEGYEADDLIATLATEGEKRGLDVFICSSDKDCRQLLSDRVKIFNLRKQTIFDAAALQEDWGVRPEQVIDYQTLVGDSVDNVPGVKGVGPKTASQYLQQYGTIENLIAHVHDLKGKKKENLQAFIPELERTRKLVTLERSVPVGLEWDQWKIQEWDGPKLHGLFTGWGFRGFAQQVRSSIRATPSAAKSALTQGSLFEGETSTPATNAAPAPDWPHEYHLVNTEERFAEFFPQLQAQKRFAVDLETTSLDPHKAEMVGFAFCWKAGEAWYLAVRGPAGEPVLEPAATLDRLRPILEDATIAKVNQNIKYDWLVFKNHGIHLAGIAGDSMVADYLLHAGTRNHNLDALAMVHLGHRNISITELIGKGKKQICMDEVPTAKVAEYAGEDADVAWRLCEKLEPRLEADGFKRPSATAPLSPERRGAGGEGAVPQTEMYLYDDLEIPLIEVLADLEATGIRLDVPLLQKMGEGMTTTLAKLEQELYTLAGCQFNINSVPQLRDILFTRLGFEAIRRTNVGGESSTDQATLETLARSDHPQAAFPRKLLEHRQIAKLKGTYVDALPEIVNPRTGRIHASFNQTVAATGRLSSSDPNLQNIPIRSDLGGQIRQAFLPESGWLLLTADYSQIELRLLAHYTGEPALQAAFAENRDIHAIVGAQIHGVDVKDVTDKMRGIAKTVNFGVLYGMSATGLATRLNISMKDGAAFIDAYFTKYPRVQSYQQTLLEACRIEGYVSTILGRRRQIEGIRDRTTYRNRNQPEREAINMQIQGSAADLIKVAMLNIHRRLRREAVQARMLLQIHDELVFEFPAQEQTQVVQLVREEMTQALASKLSVPLRVDMSIGPNWLDTTEVRPKQTGFV